MVHPHHSFGYWGPVDELFGPSPGIPKSVLELLKHVAPYLAMSTSILAREISRDGCNAILCQEYEHATFDKAVTAGRLLRIPVYGIFQGGGADWNRIGRALHPLTLRLCSGLIIGSSIEAKRVRQHYRLQEDSIHKLPNPIDPLLWCHSDRKTAREFFSLPPEAIVVAWHGRVEIVAKGLDNLLAAWEQVCQGRENRDLRLMLMGSGRDTDLLAKQIAGAKNITFIPKFTCDPTLIRQFLAAADIYALPSRYEGLPVAPTEAMACGLPVIAAEANGVRDIFEAGEDSGALIVPFNDPTAFAQALGRLIDDPALRHSLGRKARQRAMQFSAEKVGVQLKNLLLRRIREIAPAGAATA
jgi:glycosyltransferase involved in cell wall biosynthesis